MSSETKKYAIVVVVLIILLWAGSNLFSVFSSELTVNSWNGTHYVGSYEGKDYACYKSFGENKPFFWNAQLESASKLWTGCPGITGTTLTIGCPQHFSYGDIYTTNDACDMYSDHGARMIIWSFGSKNTYTETNSCPGTFYYQPMKCFKIEMCDVGSGVTKYTEMGLREECPIIVEPPTPLCIEGEKRQEICPNGIVYDSATCRNNNWEEIFFVRNPCEKISDCPMYMDVVCQYGCKEGTTGKTDTKGCPIPCECNEQEQKSWFEENILLIIGGLVLLLVGVIVWKGGKI